MGTDQKDVADKQTTFDQLELRLGRILAAEVEPSAPKPAFRLTIDFGKFGQKISVARLTRHTAEELVGQLVVGLLNLPPRQVGEVRSEVLILGTQFPKAESGEATPLVPLARSKIGGKVF